MPAPKPILRCRQCGHDLADLITAPWIRTCPECGTRFDADFVYEGNARETPEPNVLPPDTPNDTPNDTPGTDNETPT